MSSRSVHRTVGALVLLPTLVTICTGIVLMLRQDFDWIQPRAQMASRVGLPQISLSTALEKATSSYREALSLAELPEISSLEVRPKKGTVSVRFDGGYEVQIDGATGAVLSSKMRRTSWLIELHQGSWFHPTVMKGVFLPSGILLLFLWMTGVSLLVQRWFRKGRAREKVA